ncbi:MAG TPA: glycosyltransferase family 2 protein [Rhizomicrobium sp.]|nr:glycosyltransferase family 2 protein [Rhizomicrobium sp.]
MGPLFSVIIPVYNRAESLRQAIQSVRAQTCQDFEIIVVDDGSQDDPGKVALSFDDPRIRFFPQTNGGGGKARNTAIDQARGNFIAPLDSDDVFLPHHLASMKTLLEHQTGLVGYARVRVDRGGGRQFLKPPRALDPDEDMAEYLLCERGFVPTITIVVPRQAALRVRYDEDLWPAQDVDFAIRLSLAGYRFHMLEEPGAVWRDHFDPLRISASKGSGKFGAWLERMRPRLSSRAYHGARGWAYAKLVKPERRLEALGLYLNAVLRGCYRPSLAAVILLQILLGGWGYRRLADRVIARPGSRAQDQAIV